MSNGLGNIYRAASLLAWLAAASLLVPLMALSSLLGWRDSVALMLPLAAVLVAICRPARYSSPFLSARPPAFRALLMVSAAIGASGLWVMIAAALAAAYSRITPGIDSQLVRSYPLLAGIGMLFYLVFTSYYEMSLAIGRSQAAERRESEAVLLARDAELRALKAQVNPHFLFNSLHSISALTSSDPAAAREMCILLADFLRSTLGLGERDSIPFADELALTRKYLAVEKIRFRGRLRVEEHVGDGVGAWPVPPLLLQPLVENAVRHGVATMTSEGTLVLRAAIADGRLHVVVSNPYDPEAPPRAGHGLGLRNVGKRIDTRYGGRGRVDVTAKEGLWTVELKIPESREMDADGEHHHRSARG